VYLPEADELLFMCLKPKIVLEKDEDELVKGLTNKYADDISDKLSDHLVLLKLILRAKPIEIKSNQKIIRILVNEEL